MASIRRSISVRAPVGRVFDYVADPSHLPEIWPSLVAVRNVHDHPTGKSFDWDYKLMGMKFQGHSDPVELVPNERLVSRSKNGIPNTFRWMYADRDDHTEVTLEVEYQVPVLGRLAEGLVGRVNEREAETLLKNLKRKLET
ncbi:MAG TPA: SRPBCC family protein [Kofleriaceae bacterium]|nr:SRPBCC family protein [Kofleriaceae bacterium]